MRTCVTLVVSEDQELAEYLEHGWNITAIVPARTVRNYYGRASGWEGPANAVDGVTQWRVVLTYPQDDQ